VNITILNDPFKEHLKEHNNIKGHLKENNNISKELHKSSIVMFILALYFKCP